MPDIADSDVIIGYRADDSYFSFARAFLSNTITVGQLSLALKFGDLGKQYVLKSTKAFKQLNFIETIPVNGRVYYPRRRNRDVKAREKYHALLKPGSGEGIYLNELMR